MFAMYFGFILLIWFPGGLHAMSCGPPTLQGGYFVPDAQIYDQKASLYYACDSQHKPVEEGWWGTSKCENGEWVPEPRCIDANACVPPNIPNASIDAKKSWYAEESTLTVNCNEGYENKGSGATPSCHGGQWSSLPICQKSITSCTKPLKVSNAVVTAGYQEVFPANTNLMYYCKEGYLAEDQQDGKSVSCRDGIWDPPPTCQKIEDPGAGSSGAGTGVEGGTATGHEIQPTEEDPGAGFSGAGTGAGGSTATGHETQPDEGTSTTSDRHYTIIDHCWPPQNLPHMEFTMAPDRMSLTFKCQPYYRLLGSPTVRCNSDGTWSQLPTCKGIDCIAQSGPYGNGLYLHENIEEGQSRVVPCSNPELESRFICHNGRIQYSACCTVYYHRQGWCRYIQASA